MDIEIELLNIMQNKASIVFRTNSNSNLFISGQLKST